MLPTSLTPLSVPLPSLVRVLSWVVLTTSLWSFWRKPIFLPDVRCWDCLPCHLGIVYALVYLTWQEAEDWAMTWQTIEDAGMTWRDLEKYSREVEA